MTLGSCRDCSTQVVQKQEEKELKESGLEGKDAFSELVKLSSNGARNGDGATHQNDPREDLERLYRDAAEGIVVAGREATWEATRPMVLPAGESQKLRGFIDYRRHAPPPAVTEGHLRAYRPGQPCPQHVARCKGLHAAVISSIWLETV